VRVRVGVLLLVRLRVHVQCVWVRVHVQCVWVRVHVQCVGACAQAYPA
jgi:hypothetical protein